MYPSNNLELPKIVKSKNKQTKTLCSPCKVCQKCPLSHEHLNPFQIQATYTARSKGKKKALAASCAPPAFKAIQLPLLAITGDPLEPPEVLEPAPRVGSKFCLGIVVGPVCFPTKNVLERRDIQSVSPYQAYVDWNSTFSAFTRFLQTFSSLFKQFHETSLHRRCFHLHSCHGILDNCDPFGQWLPEESGSFQHCHCRWPQHSNKLLHSCSKHGTVATKPY